MSLNLMLNIFKESNFQVILCNDFNISAMASDTQSDAYYNYEDKYNGSEGTSLLVDFNPSFELLYKQIGGLVGFRYYKGNTEYSYDWWKDYTSNIAWNPNYADYYWSQSTDLEMNGFEIGFTSYFIYTKLNKNKIVHNIKLKDFIVSNASKPLNFYSIYYSVAPPPGTKGIFAFAEIGTCSKITASRLNLGIGYSY